jgi:hypothetical protein
MIVKKKGFLVVVILLFTIVANMFGGNVGVAHADTSTPDSNPVSVIEQQFEVQSHQKWNVLNLPPLNNLSQYD